MRSLLAVGAFLGVLGGGSAFAFLDSAALLLQQRRPR